MFEIFHLYQTCCAPSGRIGKIRELSFKIGLISMSQGPLDEKYRCKKYYNLYIISVKYYVSVCTLYNQLLVWSQSSLIDCSKLIMTQ